MDRGNLSACKKSIEKKPEQKEKKGYLRQQFERLNSSPTSEHLRGRTDQPEASNSKQESEADPLLNPGQKHHDESSSATSSLNIEKIREGFALMTQALYDDGQVKLDFDGLTIRRYYFPLGKSKHIPYNEIKGVDEIRMGVLTGKTRLWGGNWQHWLPLDLRRPWKEKALALKVGGQSVKPTITPDDPDHVRAILQEHIDR